MPHPLALRAILAVVSLCCAPILTAQTSVWKVTAGENTLYLGGTCHILRPQDFPLPAEFDAAFEAAGALYFETDLQRMMQPETQQVLFARGTFNDGRTLEQALNAKTWEAVQAYCAKAGLPPAQILQFRPWLFTVMIAMVELQKAGVTQEGVDLHFFKRASAAGKTAHALEEFEQHLNHLTNLGAGHESEMVLSTLEDIAEIPSLINDLIRAWQTADLAKVDELMLRDMREKYPSVYEELIVKRNRLWLPKIEKLLKTPETEFVLVGFGHMAGEAGLLAELRQRGYQVETLVLKK